MEPGQEGPKGLQVRMTPELKAAFTAMEDALATAEDFEEGDPGSELVAKLFGAFKDAVWYVSQEDEAPF